ncbi:hypothetical protein BFJ72_g14878 [Fusarium proliferatum]|uniref:Uncharacterized protein n=1 Tax=Gibberella intermedia TaxID=948311 RepID=A0A420RWV8_GIBIN|nr:hypothetical protein BFJ72_g14878 [Fusarium proliferatum]
MEYTGRIKVTAEGEGEAIDIPTMHDMPIDQYKEYVKNELFFMDHHEILRSNFCGYPYATTPAQIDAFIEVLREYKRKMVS